MSPETKDRSVPFDPASGSGPDGVLLPPRDGGEVVALLVDASVRGDLWGERAAAALAREWASRGRKVVLIDGDVETPSLHELLQTPNFEGLSDALLYGASLERVVTTPPGESFRFVASGTGVADPAALRGSPRWDTFLDQMRSSGEVVILFLPTGGSGSALLAAQGDRVLRMARPGTPSPEGLPPGFLLHPVGAPPHSQAEMADPASAPVDRPPYPSLSAVADTTPTEVPGASMRGGASASSSVGAHPSGRPSSSRLGPRPRPRGGRQKLMLLVFLVVVVIFLLGAWFGILDIPGFPGSS